MLAGFLAKFPRVPLPSRSIIASANALAALAFAVIHLPSWSAVA